MPDPAVGADLAEPLDRLLALTAQVALDLEFGVDLVAKLCDLAVREVADFGVEGEPEGCGDLARPRAADSEDVGERDFDPLLTREVDAGNTCHLALPLLVSWIGADDHGPAVPPDHAAPLTHRLD
jgi:hypothetical protein